MLEKSWHGLDVGGILIHGLQSLPLEKQFRDQVSDAIHAADLLAWDGLSRPSFGFEELGIVQCPNSHGSRAGHRLGEWLLQWSLDRGDVEAVLQDVVPSPAYALTGP